jgi:guanylate kinase
MIIVISGTSGSGKTSVVNRLLERHSDLCIAISATTRQPRPNERDGREYYFVSHEEFIQRQEQQEFIEWAKVHGNLYGTLVSEIGRIETAGQSILLDIDVQGAASIRQRYPDAVEIFIKPPSIEELERRLRQRGTEDEQDLLRRLKTAGQEIAASEEFDHIVVNEEIEAATKEVELIIQARGAGKGGNDE